MLTVVLVAGTIVAGAHPAVVGLALLVAVEPRLVIAGFAVSVVHRYVKRGKTHNADTEAAFLRAVAAELRAGTSLRIAIADAAAASPLGLGGAARLARAGAPIGRVADVLGERLRHNGVAAAAAVELSAWSGARVAGVFDGLAERATEAAELRREQRAATTQARLSALVVGLAPLAFTTLLLAGGGIESLQRAGRAGLFIVGVGLSLELAGLLVVALILRRAER